MHAATAPMRVVIGRADQELPPSMCCRGAFVRCAITGRSAMPSYMASDPLRDLNYRRGVAGDLVAGVWINGFRRQSRRL
jgi:hypothetical protein